MSSGPGLGLYLFIIGLSGIFLPYIYFKKKGPTDDSFTNMMYWLPMQKVFVVNTIVVGGVFILTMSFFLKGWKPWQ